MADDFDELERDMAPRDGDPDWELAPIDTLQVLALDRHRMKIEYAQLLRQRTSQYVMADVAKEGSEWGKQCLKRAEEISEQLGGLKQAAIELDERLAECEALLTPAEAQRILRTSTLALPITERLQRLAGTPPQDASMTPRRFRAV